MSSKINFINSPELGTPKLPLCHAASAGGLTFLSGQFAISPDTGKVVGETLGTQARQMFSNITATLKTLGKDYSDVVKCTVYLRDMKDFPEMNEIYQTYFKAPYPARTTVAVVGLPLDVLIEVELIVA